MADFRMYVNPGCPNCEAAAKFFAEKKVSVEVIAIGFDPVAQNGIRAMANGQLPLPLIVSFATQEIVFGNDPVQLERIAAAALANRAGTSHASVM